MPIRRLVYLMHDSQILVLMHHLVEPVPARAMRRTSGKGVEVLNAFPVGEGDQNVARCELGGDQGKGLAEVC